MAVAFLCWLPAWLILPWSFAAEARTTRRQTLSLFQPDFLPALLELAFAKECVPVEPGNDVPPVDVAMLAKPAARAANQPAVPAERIGPGTEFSFAPWWSEIPFTPALRVLAVLYAAG